MEWELFSNYQVKGENLGALLGPKYYSIEEKKYKRDFIACFKTQKRQKLIN